MALTARFITLEGGEGVGKSTQAEQLAAAIRERGKRVIVTREPGGTPGAEAIRALLMTGAEERWSARAEALLFAAARSDHVDRVIRPALERGDWVISDRYIDSTRAYQGGAGAIDDADIFALHRIACAGLIPDRTLLMTLGSDEATRRATARDGARADRFAARGRDYHAGLNAAFARLAIAEPERFRSIDASGSPDVVTARLVASIGYLL